MTRTLQKKKHHKINIYEKKYFPQSTGKENKYFMCVTKMKGKEKQTSIIIFLVAYMSVKFKSFKHLMRKKKDKVYI